MAYQFKIKLLNVKKPPVWRRVIIPENCTFEEFHHTIQISFGWDNNICTNSAISPTEATLR